jgi:hypothetical protein
MASFIETIPDSGSGSTSYAYDTGRVAMVEWFGIG